jgi:polar amino acid transport system substrate-binding protein
LIPAQIGGRLAAPGSASFLQGCRQARPRGREIQLQGEIMRTFTRLAAAAAALTVVAAMAHAKDWTVVRIGVDATYPPFEFTGPDGTIQGFSIDIANALCERMNVTCEYINQDWEGIIPALLANKFDAIVSSMSITEERMLQVDFTDKYYNTPPAVAVPQDSTLTGVTPEELAGATIGAQVSTTHANYVQEKLPESELRTYPSPDEYKLDLTNGRLDAAVDDIVVLNDWLSTPEGACCKILGTITPDPIIHGPGAGIAIRKEDTDLKDMFNAALKEILEDGTYKEINAKHFDFDVYGG